MDADQVSDSANHLLHLINDIERAVVFLTAQPAVREVGSQARNPNRPGSREPVSLDLIDVCAEVPAMLTSWVRLVLEERDAEATDDASLDVGPDGTAVTQLCRWLRQRVTWIAVQPWVDDLGNELAGLRHRLQRAPGSPLLREVIGRMRCTQTGCDGHVITRQQDREYIVKITSRCDLCAHAYDEAAVDVARAEQAARLDWQEADTIVSTLTAAGAEVTVDQVHKWGDRHLIGRRKQAGRRRYLPEEVARRVRRDRQASELQACSSPATVRVASRGVSAGEAR